MANPNPKPFAKPGPGRPKGVPNKANAEIKSLAQQHCEDALKTLAELSKTADSDAAKIAACRELLDRGYGKPTQTIAGDPENPIQMVPLINVGIGEAGPKLTSQARNGAFNGSH